MRGNGVKVTLKRHEAKWHKSCFNKCSTLKLQRAQKRKLEDSSVEASEAPSPVKTHTSPGISPKEVAKESRQTFFFVMKLEIFAEQPLLHLRASSEQSLQDCKTENF